MKKRAGMEIGDERESEGDSFQMSSSGFEVNGCFKEMKGKWVLTSILCNGCGCGCAHTWFSGASCISSSLDSSFAASVLSMTLTISRLTRFLFEWRSAFKFEGFRIILAFKICT